MKYTTLLPYLGILSPWLSSSSSACWKNISYRRSIGSAASSPLSSWPPSARPIESSGYRRQRVLTSTQLIAGINCLRAGDASSITADDHDRISRRGGASVDAAQTPTALAENSGSGTLRHAASSDQRLSSSTGGTLPRTATDALNSEADEASHKEYAKKLKNRNRTNLSRKFTHAGFGIFFACLNQFLPHSKFVPGMAILTSATLLMELLRYRKWFGWMNDALHFVLGSSLRKHEMEGKFTGSFYYFAGVTATSYLFPQTAATMGICQLALADPSASYFGRRTRHIYWSRIENGLGGLGRNKGILGFLGGALFCFPFNYRVFKIAKWGAKGIPGGQASIITASLLLGLAGAFADLAVPTPALTMPKKVLGVPVPPFHVDDNFVVPIFSGYACTQIFNLIGWDGGLQLANHIIF